MTTEFQKSRDADKVERAQVGERQRVQLDFSPQAYERLLQIRELAGARTNAEVVRNALRIYEWFLDQKRAKHKLQLVTDNSVKEIELLL